MPLIALDNVTKVYPKGTRPALDDVTVHIDRGDFVFLVGASGSGKTTLLSLLLREEEATSGEIHVAGNDLRRLTNRQVPLYRRSIGFIFQDYKLLNNKTVWQNVAFALEVIGTARSTIRSLVPKVLQTVGLTGKEDSYPHELSGGEAQRVSIARAYVNHPQILLADEPTGNLDPTTSLGIMEVLEAINRTGTTIVMATHNEEIVNSMRKRVVELHGGRIVRDERHGSYDSALFFPDADVAAKSRSVLDGVADPADLRSEDDADARFRPHHGEAGGIPSPADSPDSAEVLPAAQDEEEDGIARLAKSVHSGRTGRYGEAFAPLETTMTWGRGLSLDEADGSDGPDDTDKPDGTDGADAPDNPQGLDGHALANPGRTDGSGSLDGPVLADAMAGLETRGDRDGACKPRAEGHAGTGGAHEASDMPPLPPLPPSADDAGGRNVSGGRTQHTDGSAQPVDAEPLHDGGAR